MKFSLKSSLKALLACAMMLQVGVISAKAEGEIPGSVSTLSNSLTLDDMTVTMTNEDLTSDPTDGVANVEKLIQSNSYAGLFDGDKTNNPGDANDSSRDFEFKWNTGNLPAYVKVPVTIHFNMGTDGKTLTRASVYNANVGNGYVTKGKFTVTYKDEAPVEGDPIEVGNTDYSEFRVALDASKKVVNIDFTVLEVKDGATNMLTLSEAEFVNETNVISKGVSALEASTTAEGSIAELLDNDNFTYWHSSYSEGVTMPQWVTFDLGAAYKLSDVDILARVHGGHGDVTKAEILIGDSLDDLKSVGIYTFEKADNPFYQIKNRNKYQNMHLTSAKGRYVKLNILGSTGSKNSWTEEDHDHFVSISEVKFYGTPDKSALSTAIQNAKNAIDGTLADSYTSASLTAYRNKITEAENVYNSADATVDQINAQIEALNDIAKLLVEKGDIAALNTAISNAEAKIAGDEANKYTASSVTAYQTVIDNAKTLAAKNNNATKTEVDAMIKQLNDAAELIAAVDKTSLINLIANAETEAAKTTVYTTVSIAALQTVIDTAKLLKDNGDATAEQVTAQITALEDAIKALVRLADKAALKAKIDEVKALDTTGKTPNSVSALQDAITAAEAVYNDAQAVQAAADEQVTKLTEAVGKLVDKANTAALADAIAAAEAEVAKTDTYTEASINAVKAIIAEATTLKNNGNATQAEVDAEVTKLNNAVAAMDKIGETVDKTPLTDLIADAKTEVAKTDVYTAESLAALQQAIDVAEAAVDTVDSSVAVQEQVDLLQAAIDALEEKGNTPDPTPVDKSDLVTAINNAKNEADKTDVYTAESLAVLQEAIDAAEAVNADEDATEADVIAAIEAIKDAVGALEEKGNTPDPTPVDKSDLVTAINDAKAEAAKTDVYTEESIVALLEAIDAAEAVNADENATEADVTAAIEAINDAVNALVEADDPTPETPKESFSATDKATNVHVSAQAGVVDPNAELVVTPVTDTNANDKIATALKSLGGKQLAYDITLLLNNVEIQPNGMLQITLNIPKGFFNSSLRPKLYHISDDGKVTQVELTRGAMLADGSGWVQFYTDHLSVYVLVSEANEVIKPNQPIDKNPLAPSNPVKDTATNAATPNTGDNTMAMTYVMLLVCAGAFLVLSYKRKNDKA